MVDISICIVSLNCWGVLKNCLDSLRASYPAIDREIILVDNASSDGTPEKIRANFPEVQLVQNKYNVGFTKATNQAIALSSGRYILWLNPDTILRPDTLHKMYRFMEANPKVGIVGPKVLNPDGTFQPQCRRGMPTPLASLYYFLKLHRLWPQSPVIGQYLLTYLPVENTNQVDAVSGCCLMARREVWRDIGALDENIFGFGEDIDWCVRAKQVGWEVWYYPESVLIHIKGQGGVHSKPYHKVFGIHQAMWVFYHKHLMTQYAWPITALVRLGVWGRLAVSITGVWFHRTVSICLNRSVLFFSRMAK
jgi:GT2 family glycosyltransferase